MKRTIMRLAALSCAAACLVLTALLGACGGVPEYPALLSQADSAFMQGRYHEGDSLMEAYSRQTAEADEDDDVRAYRQLLQLEQSFCHGSLAEPDFSLADSLERCYRESEEPIKHAKTLLFVGNLYEITGNYPAALNNYLQAATLAEQQHDTRLLCLVSRCQGDLYFAQRMLEECIPFYKMNYSLAKNNSDTLRMAYAAFNMGRVHSVRSQIDSIVFFYKEAIELAGKTDQSASIVPYATYQLCDIYIQTEQFDSALAIMPRDELNDANWAYWHLGQNHLDSAAYYFKSMLGKYGHRSDVEYLRILAALEQQRGNAGKALEYYAQLPDAEDSLQTESQAEATSRVQAQYNYKTIVQERDKLISKNRQKRNTIVFLIVLYLAAIVVALLSVVSYRQKKRMVGERGKLLKKEQDIQLRNSQQQLEQNRRRIIEVEENLKHAEEKGETEVAARLKLATDVLNAEIKNIEVQQRKAEMGLDQLKHSDVYQKVMKHRGQPDFTLDDSEWQQLGHYVDGAFNQFSSRLLDLAPLKGMELNACWLLKLGLQPTDVALMVMRSRSAVTMMAKRLYKKFTKKSGSAQEFYEFILNF